MWNAAPTCRCSGSVFAVALIAVSVAIFAPTAGAGVDRKAPSTPSGVVVTGATSSTVSLAWQRSTDRRTGVAGYRLYLDGLQVAVTQATSYTFGGLSCGRTYTLGVQSYDRAGNSSRTSSVRASTGGCPDVTAPTAPANLAQTGSTQTAISLTWSASADNVGVARYNLYRDGALVVEVQGTSYTFTGLACGRSYSFTVVALDAAGNVSPASAVLASTSPCPDSSAPSTPSFLLQTTATTGTVSLSWAASLDNVGVAGYGVYSGGVRVATTTLTSHTLAGLACGTTYSLAVDAYDAAGNRSPRAAVLAATSACPSPVTTTLTFSPGADTRVEEAAPTANFGGSSTLRAEAGGDPVVSSYLRFAVSGLTGPVVGAKLRLYSQSVTANGPAVYPAATDWSETAVTWQTRPARLGDAAADAASIGDGSWVEYDVTRLVRGNGTVGFMLATDTTDGVNFSSREGAAPPRLVVTASTGTTDAQPPPSSLADTQPPSAPTALRRSGGSASTIALSWTAASDNVGVTGYGLYLNGSRVASTGATAYTFGGLACGTNYALAVDAYDAAGNRSPQAPLSAATDACPPPQPAPPPPPPPPAAATSCDKVAATTGSDTSSGSLASPYRTAQKLADSLAAGQTGCLRGGTYGGLRVSSGGTSGARLTLRSYPSERATLGNITVSNGAPYVTLAALAIEGTGGQITINLYAADVIIEDSDITNAWRGDSCLLLGNNAGSGQATRAIVRRNRFHECGALAHGNKDHAIYAANVVDGQIVDNVFWNSAAYALHLYPNTQRTRVARNVVDGTTPSVRGGLLFGGDSSYSSRDNVVEYNVIAYAQTYNIESWWDAAVGSGNVARNNCLWAGRQGNVSSERGFTASANTIADPLFVDRANRDYRLQAASPCKPVVGF